MARRDQGSLSFGDLVVSVYEEANALTSDRAVAALLVTRRIKRWLLRTGNLALARQLSG